MCVCVFRSLPSLYDESGSPTESLSALVCVLHCMSAASHYTDSGVQMVWECLVCAQNHTNTHVSDMSKEDLISFLHFGCRSALTFSSGNTHTHTIDGKSEFASSSETGSDTHTHSHDVSGTRTHTNDGNTTDFGRNSSRAHTQATHDFPSSKQSVDPIEDEHFASIEGWNCVRRLVQWSSDALLLRVLPDKQSNM